ncbi:MAG: CCA tRNA nucleotidyltransferase [Candidatus Berkelbacteria bacterium]|nr:CCA tRNA nucleotidyltransferase [Candidatus Berkelbacteria bacterium]MCR4307547.1 CCA tRNA nucleotidyltransferase [Candidatus Berkelbacteria bacterium]
MPVSVPAWLESLEEAFADSGHQLYIVGGAIRDELLGRKVGEWDLATDAKPSEVEKILRQKTKKIGLIGKRFGTVTADLNGNAIEITTFRGESYEEHSRKPTVEFGNSINEDLSRRDFTINAIAYDLRFNRVIDNHNGEQDLKARVIRAVGDPESRFREDPLRMLRAIRFAVTLDFEIEHNTFQAINLERERFAILSVERISQEMDKILLSPKPSRGIDLLVESGLINYILPELIPCIDLEFDPAEHKDIYSHILQVLDQTPAKLELRWCALLHDIAKPLTRQKIGGEYHFLGHEVVGARLTKDILRRLKYGNEFIDYLSKLVYLHQRIPNNDGHWTDGAVRRFVRDANQTLEDLFTFAEADSTGGNERKLEKYKQMRAELRDRIVELEKQAEIAKIHSPLDGEELMKIFHRPAGVWIKPIKEHLLQLVLDNQLDQEDKLAAEQIARQLMRQ